MIMLWQELSKKVWWELKEIIFLIHTIFLTMVWISLFHCCKKVLTLMNTWMIRKNSLKLCYLKNKTFYSHLNMEDITDADTGIQKEFLKVEKFLK